jgi:hypothetical protein
VDISSDGACEAAVTSKVIRKGRVISQAVSRRPGFEPRSGHVGFVVGKVAPG